MKKSKLSSTRSRKRSTANSKAKTNHRKKLNVRVNSKKSVSVRRKLFMIRFLKWSAVAAILCVIAIGVYRGVDRFLFESPKFSLTKINYQTDGALPEARVLRNSGIKLGDNVLRINIKDAKERILTELPMIKEAEIIRKMPGSLTINISEREPIAWLSGPQVSEDNFRTLGGVLLDQGGTAFLAEEPVMRFENYPVIISSEFSNVTPGKRLNSSAVQSGIAIAVEFSEQFSQSPVLMKSLYSKNDFSIIGYLNTGAEITFGFDDIPRQISDLKLLLAEATRRGRVLAEANVMVKKNTPVKFANNFVSDSVAPRAVPVTRKTAPMNTESEKKLKILKKIAKPIQIPKALPVDNELEGHD